MNVLSKNDFSFLHSPRYSSADRMSLHVYEKGYESLIHQKYIHHPTGMVFNRDLIAQHLCETDYQKFVPFVYTYDFLMLDLLQYEKSAILDYGYWSARPMSYLRNHRAGTGPNLYFLPETREKIFYKVFEHVLRQFTTECLTTKKYILQTIFISTSQFCFVAISWSCQM